MILKSCGCLNAEGHSVIFEWIGCRWLMKTKNDDEETQLYIKCFRCFGQLWYCNRNTKRYKNPTKETNTGHYKESGRKDGAEENKMRSKWEEEWRDRGMETGEVSCTTLWMTVRIIQFSVMGAQTGPGANQITESCPGDKISRSMWPYLYDRLSVAKVTGFAIRRCHVRHTYQLTCHFWWTHDVRRQQNVFHILCIWLTHLFKIHFISLCVPWRSLGVVKVLF